MTSQVGEGGDGQPHLGEMSVEGVSYEPVGAIDGLKDDAMEHGGMRDLASVSATAAPALHAIFRLLSP